MAALRPRLGGPCTPTAAAPEEDHAGAPIGCGRGTIGGMTARQESPVAPASRRLPADAAGSAVAPLVTAPATGAASVSAVRPAAALQAYGAGRRHVRDDAAVPDGPYRHPHRTVPHCLRVARATGTAKADQTPV